MNKLSALRGVALLCAIGLSSPVNSQDSGDSDPGGGSETTPTDNRPGDSNDADSEPPGGDEDFGDTWEPEPGTGEDLDDRDIPGSDGSATDSPGNSNSSSDLDPTDSTIFEQDSSDSDWNYVNQNNGRGG